MAQPGDIISHDEMARIEGRRLQKGMNIQRGRSNSVFLMSRRPNAPYKDAFEDEGQTLVYEGHDIRPVPGVDPKGVDQPLSNPNGKPTDNGWFFEQAQRFKAGFAARRVRVYEKIKPNIWVYVGLFDLVDAWVENGSRRKVCKFRLHIVDERADIEGRMEHSRAIPGDVAAAVWKRDGGKCQRCGAEDNLHFDHIIPFSKGGTSLRAENLQILCARHNLAKRDRI